MPGVTSETVSSKPLREKLDVETSEEREARLGKLLSAQEQDRSRTQDANPTIALPPLRPDIGPMPQSDLLSRVRNFLPQLAASNEDLLARARANPSEVDIEITQGDERVIEMDLGLGVYDVQGQTGQAGQALGPEVDLPSAAGRQEGGDGADVDRDTDEMDDTESDTDDSDSDSDSDSDMDPDSGTDSGLSSAASGSDRGAGAG